ncbi:hypothetical protein CEXT_518581 [Caerostris extrusa]|uniref:Uncharacterized protein n=1 Tax=Caerostris extrusa TaxID=172846 RepID=A0AAV4TVI7_CAEEX|nr:hypothetical protein CEXT_518581 [Caerostris extrusa]
MKIQRTEKKKRKKRKKELLEELFNLIDISDTLMAAPALRCPHPLRNFRPPDADQPTTCSSSKSKQEINDEKY